MEKKCYTYKSIKLRNILVMIQNLKAPIKIKKEFCSEVGNLCKGHGKTLPGFPPWRSFRRINHHHSSMHDLLVPCVFLMSFSFSLSLGYKSYISLQGKVIKFPVSNIYLELDLLTQRYLPGKNESSSLEAAF